MSAADPEEKRDADPSASEPIFKFKKKVDDDWKRKVEEEKERLSEPPPAPPRRDRPARAAEGAPAEGAPAGAARPAPGAPSPAPAPGGAPEPPPPEDEAYEEERAGAPATPFLRFVGDLANQALTALGVYPDPMTRTRQVSLEQARYIIDVLRILKEKTKGNLTPDEQRVVDGLLYELQLQYVEVNR